MDAESGHVEVYDAKTIEESGAESVADFLDRAVNLQVRTLNANPMQSQLAMRGFGANSFGRVKVLVDGVEQGGPDMCAPDLSRIAIDALERVEVVNGPSPVTEGDGAVAGTIALYTNTRDYSPRTRLYVKVGSNGTAGLGAKTKGGLKDDGIFYSAGYDYLRSDGYRWRSGYDYHTVNGMVRKNFLNGAEAGFRMNYSNGFYEMPGTEEHPYADDWCRVWRMDAISDCKAPVGDEGWFKVSAAFSRTGRTSNWGDYGYQDNYDIYTYRLRPSYENGGFIVGADFGYDYMVSSLYSDFHRLRGAGYMKYRYEVTDTLAMEAGARGEEVWTKWQEDVLSGYEIGAVYRPWEIWKFYWKSAYFYRSAYADEISYTKNGEMLEPERGFSVDVGTEGVIAEEWRVGVNGYAMWMEDEIFYDPYRRYNWNSPGKTRRLGFDSWLGWKREGVAEASVKYSFVDARFASGDYDGKVVPMVAGSRIRAEAGVWLGDEVKVKGGMKWVARQWLDGDYRNEHERLKGYAVFDVGAEWEPRWAKGWKASFVMDNLFDRKYCDYAGWSDWTKAYHYPAAGRSFLFTLAYEF